ncbi:Uncharacterised protein [Helicobacter fennelliae]|uniref:Flagellar protein n=2 Tax=Helicobacter fennelliae TaxID=215 RepID=T1CR15_9HELI|nr:hypothetical protein [Helicobacter fennelliae]GAD19189.1 hypothetical protein HFN_0320 [Helicobacter fennelliae MRY12-0050]SQB98981.1 Uncharacterised protein [Helicobacter fennelliae]STP08263.1 Uncharacterised protein [Helicobacter fennelliae]STQ84673.1 Uncharacterised protein [Helicobacter fennelliae]
MFIFKPFCIVAIFVCNVFGTAIKDIKINYFSSQRLDLLLMLDSEFKGEIGTASIQNKKLTMISNLTISKIWNTKFQESSPILAIQIIPKNNNIYLEITPKKHYYLKPSISKDKNTIRLSFFAADEQLNTLLKSSTTLKPTPIQDVFSPEEQARQNKSTPSISTPTSSTSTASTTSTSIDSAALDSATESTSDSLFSNQSLQTLLDKNFIYYVAIGIGVIIVLLFVRYWLKKSTHLNGTIKIASQSQVDSKNKIVIFETRDFFYMVLIGEKNNMLIDKIPREKAFNAKGKKDSQSSQTIGDENTFNDDFWNSLTKNSTKK